MPTQTTLFYHSAMAGMPAAATNTAGGLIAVLDACLVNGANTISVTGIVQTGGTATATTSGNHNFAVGHWVDVSGATPSAYNGRVKVTAATSNTFSYAVDAGTATPASGTLSAKHPGAGWTKTFAGTNTAGYRSDAAGMGHHIQIEDNNPYSDSNVTVRARLCAGLTALNSADQLGEQCRIDKGSTGWVVVADAKTCYIVFDAGNTFCFGELAPLFAGDSYAWFMTRGRNADTESRIENATSSIYVGRHFPLACGSSAEITTHASAEHGAKILRSYSQMGGDVEAIPGHMTFVTSGYSNYCGNMYATQRAMNGINPADGALSLAPVLLAETGASLLSMRGTLRGLYQPMGLLVGGGFSAQGVQRMDDTLINGQLRSVAVVQCGSATYRAQIAFDLGNWS